MFIKKKVIAKLFKAKDSNKCAYHKVKKVIVKLFKHKDSIQECLFKKNLLWNFLNVEFRAKYVYYKKVIVKLFKRKDSIEICLLKKGYCETF